MNTPKPDQTDILAENERLTQDLAKAAQDRDGAQSKVGELEGKLADATAELTDAKTKASASEQTVARLQTELEAVTKERDALKTADHNFNTRLAAELAKHGIRAEGVPMPGMTASAVKPAAAVNWTERALAHLRASAKAAAAIVAVCLLGISAPTAEAQNFKLIGGDFGGVPGAIAQNTSTNLAAASLGLYPDRGATLVVEFTGVSAAATNDVVVAFRFSRDGTNKTTANDFTVTLTGLGAARAMVMTNLPASYVGAKPFLHVHNVTTGATTGITNLTVALLQAK